MRHWYEMRKTENKGVVNIFDFIGKSFWDDSGVDATKFNAELKALGDVDVIDVHINSPGGNVYDGVSIMNALAFHKATINVHIDGIAASAASLIAMAGDKIIMPTNTFMLIHEPSSFAWGKQSDMLAAAADLEKLTKTFTATYAKRSGQSQDEVRALLAEDRLMSAEEALELGYADETPEPVKVATAFSPFAVMSAPESVRMFIEKMKADDADDEKTENAGNDDGVVETGKGEGEDDTGSEEDAASGGDDASGIDDDDATAATAKSGPAPSNVVPLTARKGEANPDTAAIMQACKVAKVDHTAQAYIDAGMTIEQVRVAINAMRADEIELSNSKATVNTKVNQTAAKDLWAKAHQRAGVNVNH